MGGGLTHVGPSSHVLDGSRSQWEGQCGGCPAMAVSAAVYTMKGSIQSLITACNRRDHLSSITAQRDAAFVKIF